MAMQRDHIQDAAHMWPSRSGSPGDPMQICIRDGDEAIVVQQGQPPAVPGPESRALWGAMEGNVSVSVQSDAVVVREGPHSATGDSLEVQTSADREAIIVREGHGDSYAHPLGAAADYARAASDVFLGENQVVVVSDARASAAEAPRASPAGPPVVSAYKYREDVSWSPEKAAARGGHAGAPPQKPMSLDEAFVDDAVERCSISSSQFEGLAPSHPSRYSSLQSTPCASVQREYPVSNTRYLSPSSSAAYLMTPSPAKGPCPAVPGPSPITHSTLALLESMTRVPSPSLPRLVPCRA